MQVTEIISSAYDRSEGPVDILLDGNDRYLLYYMTRDLVHVGNRGIGLAKQDITTGTFIYNKQFECSDKDVVPKKIMIANGTLYCLAQVLTKYPLYPATGPVLLKINPSTGSITNSYFFPTPVGADFCSRAADLGIFQLSDPSYGEDVYILGYTQHTMVNSVTDFYISNKLFIIRFSTTTNNFEYKEFYDPNNKLYFNPVLIRPERIARNDYRIVGTVYDNTTQQKKGLDLNRIDNLSVNNKYSFDIDGKEIAYAALTTNDGFGFLYGQIKTGATYGLGIENDFYFDSPFYLTHDFYEGSLPTGILAETWQIKNAALLSHDRHTFDYSANGTASRGGRGLFLFYSNQQTITSEGNFGAGVFYAYNDYFQSLVNNSNLYQLHTSSYKLRGALYSIGLSQGPNGSNSDYIVRNAISSREAYCCTTPFDYEVGIARDAGSTGTSINSYYTFNNAASNCNVDVQKTQGQGTVYTHNLNITETQYSSLADSPISIIENDLSILSNYVCDEPFRLREPAKEGLMPVITYEVGVEPKGPKNLQAIEAGKSNEKTGLRIYPNPIRNNMHISTLQKAKEAVLFDLQGKQLKREGGLNSTENTLFFAGLAKGSYLLKVIYWNGISDTKIVIKQ